MLTKIRFIVGSVPNVDNTAEFKGSMRLSMSNLLLLVYPSIDCCCRSAMWRRYFVDNKLFRPLI
uniref:Uncharacterized protein n=1 Tax=Hyaloperonospora arabidopsidis (strain Emoy2) TaxID=559515 RepID=M4BFD4_HYAAE